MPHNHPHPETHYVHRAGWLRAAILGANDGLISTSALIVGVVAAGQTGEALLVTGLAGLVAGALSMAAGEYVSVSSQSDIEKADLEREAKGLAERPETEMSELAHMFMARGVERETAFDVAKQMHDHDALEAHAREELGIMELTRARPWVAAFASALAFAAGAIWPILIALLNPNWIVPITLVLLLVLGAMGAMIGGTRIFPAAARVFLWGSFAMGATALIGRFVAVAI